jgi:hypothetical protein
MDYDDADGYSIRIILCMFLVTREAITTFLQTAMILIEAMVVQVCQVFAGVRFIVIVN